MSAPLDLAAVEGRPRDRRILWLGLAAILLVIAAWEAAQLWRIIGDQDAIGVDLVFYQDMGRRWLETGTFYTERQLSGPYATMTLVDNLYPPHALYLFVPMALLPSSAAVVAWWGIPLALMAYCIWRLRPPAWSWPLFALVLALPKTPTALIFGNSDLWVAAAVAAGILWGWPAVLATFKPSLGFFALIGSRQITWWFMVAILVVLNTPLFPLWLEYPRVMLNNTSAGIFYSLGNMPFMLLPVLAWLVSPVRSPVRRFRDEDPAATWARE